MRCWHCGNVFTPATSGEIPVEVSCPACGAKLGLYSPAKVASLPKRDRGISLPVEEVDPPQPCSHAPQNEARRSASNVVLLIAGLVFLAIGGVMALESHEIATSYERAHGHLIKKEMVRTGRRVSCIGTIAFTAHDGQTYQAEIGGARSMRLGDPVNVLYRRDNPNVNRADATSSLWGFPMAFGGIGCVLMMIWMVAPGARPLPSLHRRRRDD